MATLDGARWSDVGNKEDFLYVYGGGTDWSAAEAGWEHEHNQALINNGWGRDSSNGSGSNGGSGDSRSSGGSGSSSLTNPANNNAAIQAANHAAQIKYQNT